MKSAALRFNPKAVRLLHPLPLTKVITKSCTIMQTNSIIKLDCEQYLSNLHHYRQQTDHVEDKKNGCWFNCLPFGLWVSRLTSTLPAVAGPAAVPVVGVEHGDVAALVLQIHALLQLLQSLVHAHVGVGELCTETTQRGKLLQSVFTSEIKFIIYKDFYACLLAQIAADSCCASCGNNQVMWNWQWRIAFQ